MNYDPIPLLIEETLVARGGEIEISWEVLSTLRAIIVPNKVCPLSNLSPRKRVTLTVSDIYRRSFRKFFRDLGSSDFMRFSVGSMLSRIRERLKLISFGLKSVFSIGSFRGRLPSPVRIVSTWPCRILSGDSLRIGNFSVEFNLFSSFACSYTTGMCDPFYERMEFRLP